MPAPASPENLTVALLGPNLARHPDKIVYLCEEEAISYVRNRQVGSVNWCRMTGNVHSMVEVRKAWN